MNDRNQEIVRGAFREYYFKQSSQIEMPQDIAHREFGYMHLAAGMTRHLSFKSGGEVMAGLVREVPSDVYCSNAVYRFPTLPMNEKQWQGADLIFDIDGKDLDLPCVPSHTYRVCSSCKHVSPPSEKEYACPSCASKKAEHMSIPCSKCIDGSKKEAKRLIGFLIEDLGIDKSLIRMYFSGNNGFHFHIDDELYRPLDSPARSDLVGYLSGIGLMAESIGVRKSPGSDLAFVKFPKGGLDYGWRKKIADRLKIDATSAIKLSNRIKEKGFSAFKSEVDSMAREAGVRIDPQVTTDVHRVFRMPGTLNSKSGLAKKRCDIDQIDSFDPFQEACLLGDSKIKVHLKTPVKFSLKGESFRISKESAELPAFAAVYLICKGLADAS